VTYDEFDQVCSRLPATTKVIQWGGSRVWKVGGEVGGKVFAIGGWNDDEPGFTFKVDEETFGFLCDQTGLRPAPYFASRGMKWIQHYARPGLSDDQLRDFLVQSHQIVSLGLTKKKQKELGLNQ
jgi:predicted DNA-binding protein (MmcQ/YjbR family)